MQIKLGLLFELLGTWCICKAILIEKWEDKKVFKLWWDENKKIFRVRDKIIFWIGDICFFKIETLFFRSKAQPEKHIEFIREGNKVTIGFLFILMGVILQITA